MLSVHSCLKYTALCFYPSILFEWLRIDIVQTADSDDAKQLKSSFPAHYRVTEWMLEASWTNRNTLKRSYDAFCFVYLHFLYCVTKHFCACFSSAGWKSPKFPSPTENTAALPETPLFCDVCASLCTRCYINIYTRLYRSHGYQLHLARLDCLW